MDIWDLIYRQYRDIYTKEEIDEVMKKMMPALDRDSNKEVTKEEWSTVCVLLTSKDNEKN